jgi:UDP-N-acetylmuramate dehydrogenase
VLDSVDVFELLSGAPRRIDAAEANLSYRGSELPQDGVVVGARVALVHGDRGTIRARMDEAREWRRRTQPLAEPNCGSVFKNPPADSAARLIEEAGGKGMSVGGASVSGKHANFIVAAPGARASDVVELIRAVRDRVLARSGVVLEPEVHLVGDLDLASR